MAKQDIEFPVREDYPLAPEDYPQPLPETEFRQPDGAAEAPAPPGDDYVNPDEKAEFSPPGSSEAEERSPSGRKRRIRRLLFSAAALVLLGLLYGRSGGEPIPAAVVTPGEPVYTSLSDIPLPTVEPEPLGNAPVIDTDFFFFSHEHHARIYLSNTAAVHSVRVNVRETVLDKPVYECYLSDEEIDAGVVVLPVLSTGDLYEQYPDEYSSAGWPQFEMTVTAWYESESGNGEDTLELTVEPDYELGISVSYMPPEYSWSETVPPDSFYLTPWQETDQIRYVIADPSAVTDPLTFSVDLSWNGRHAAPEDYEVEFYYTGEDPEKDDPHLVYTKKLVLRRPEWMPEEGTLHATIVQRLASTDELWIREIDLEYPTRYDLEF